MKVVQVNYRFDEALVDPDALLDRYTTLTGWSSALLEAGAHSVSVVQKFHQDATVTRNGVEYVFSANHVNRAVTRALGDIVHVNGLDSPLQTSALRLRLPSTTPIVVQDHGSQVPGEHGGRLQRVARHTVRTGALRAADAFLFTAREQAEAWYAAGLIASHQPVYQVLEASTTLRPIDRIEARRASGLHGAPALLWVGRLNANKDPLTVLEGFERARALLPDAGLTMVYGEDDLLAEARRRVDTSASLAACVRFAGRVPHEQLPALYSAADLFVLGSHREGSGYALIEACACGAVPVVTSIPTFRAITGDGKIGSLWTTGDPASFAAAIAAVAHGDLVSARSRCIGYFERALSWPVVGREAMNAYRDVISRAR